MKTPFFKFAWLMLLGGWLFAIGLSASADELEDFELPRTLTLEPITSGEILKAIGLNQPSINLQTLSVQSFHGDGGLRMRQAGSPVAQQTIARSYSAAWQVKAPEHIRPEALNVDYRLVSCGGKANALSYADDPNSWISVSIQALAPHVISTETRVIPIKDAEADPLSETTAAANLPDETTVPESKQPKAQVKRFNVIQGGILVQLLPDRFSDAGSYCGTLTVSVNAD